MRDLVLEVDVVGTVFQLTGARGDAAVEIEIRAFLKRLDHALAFIRLIDQQLALVVDELGVEGISRNIM